ncbi:cytochrome b562 [Luteolibacter luteus]|uniref:Cytochrome b562 n=1 Tax=Luteolibacter luteus TaxID=2728835 RepID=A0A858RKI4_9BACT|nr:cytochrome b562 [Luteolibacter luteus]QJE97101.1 hypothetical protein HHL09_15335 [Luteolibacter luteus]
MKKLIFPAFLLAATLVMPLPVRADDDTPLAKEMEKLDEAYKSFRRETDAAKGAAAAREAQSTVLKAIPLTPAMLEKMPAGEAKDKALAAYRLQMGKLFVSLCEVESAFVAKDLDAVAKLVDTLKGEKKDGHDKFIEEEE